MAYSYSLHKLRLKETATVSHLGYGNNAITLYSCSTNNN